MKIELEGLKIVDEDSLHRELGLKLNLPEYYGHNLDALWDCLTSWVDLPINIVWKNHDVSQKNLGNYFDKVIKLFLEIHEEDDRFTFILN